MPTTIYLPKQESYLQNIRNHSGIDITWYKTKQILSIGGWYDGMVGIEGESLTLREFFDRLGITEKDCRKAFKQELKFPECVYCKKNHSPNIACQEYIDRCLKQIPVIDDDPIDPKR